MSGFLFAYCYYCSRYFSLNSYKAGNHCHSTPVEYWAVNRFKRKKNRIIDELVLAHYCIYFNIASNGRSGSYRRHRQFNIDSRAEVETCAANYPCGI
jgi:hypothetical protein